MESANLNEKMEHVATAKNCLEYLRNENNNFKEYIDLFWRAVNEGELTLEKVGTSPGELGRLILKYLQ